jgi:hypothetical protein
MWLTAVCCRRRSDGGHCPVAGGAQPGPGGKRREAGRRPDQAGRDRGAPGHGGVMSRAWLRGGGAE